MSLVTVPVSAGKEEDSRKINVQYDFGSNLQEAMTKFGEATVFSAFVAAAKVDLQGLVRRKLNATVDTGEKNAEGQPVLRPVSDEEIHQIVAAWSPDAKNERVTKSKSDKALEAFGSLDADAQKELLKKLAEAAGIEL